MRSATGTSDRHLPLHDGAAARSDVYYGIQILRAVAAMLVVARHAGKAVTHSEATFAVGQCGVDIFFVISGVVIYLTGRDLDWSLFLRRRIARIVPLYWLMTALALAVNVVQAQHDSASHAVLSFFFIPARAADGGIMPPLYVGWTLNFEMWFYLACAMALALRALLRFLWAISAIIGAAVLIGMPLLAVQSWTPTPATVLLMPILLEFMAGLWLAHAVCSGRRSSPLVCALLIAGAIAWLALAPVATVMAVWRPLSWGVPAIAITWAMLSLEKRLPFARWTFGLMFAEASYALYLVHPLVIGANRRLAATLWPDLPMAVLCVMMIASAIAAGLALHYFVELRLVAFAKQRLGLGRSKRQERAGLPTLSPLA